MTKKIVSLIIISSMIILTGCWDYMDIDKRTIALGVGVEIGDEKVHFTIENARISSIQKEQSGKQQLRDVYVAHHHGKNFEEARLKINSGLPYPVFLGATRVVVWGKNFAKKGIEPYLNRIDKIYDYRKTVLAVISREDPQEVFNLKINRDIAVSFLIENTINNLTNRGSALYKTIGELLSDIAMDDVGDLMPYIGIEEGTVEYLGLVVLKNGKLVGIIDLEDTDGAIYMIAEDPTLVEEIKSPEGNNTFSFQINIKKRDITTQYKEEKVIINTNLELRGELQYQYSIRPISEELVKKMEKVLSDKIKKDIEDIFKRSQEEFKCDIFSIAKYFRADYPEVYKNMNWEKEYLDAELNLDIKTTIQNLAFTDPNAESK